jgi:hypothetical protein
LDGDSRRYEVIVFGRIHQTLRVTLAMEAGLTDLVWSLEEIAALADQGLVTVAA